MGAIRRYIEALTGKLCETLASGAPLRRISRGPTDDEYLDRFYLFGRAPAHFPSPCQNCKIEHDWRKERYCRAAGRFGQPCEPTPIKARFNFLPTVFLHHFLDSDQEDELHNHPWENSVSFMLAGGYDEERAVGLAPGEQRLRTTWRRIQFPAVNVIRGTDYHRVHLIGRDAWTLFITGRKASSWGFLTREGGEHVPWREYRKYKMREKAQKSGYEVSKKATSALDTDAMLEAAVRILTDAGPPPEYAPVQEAFYMRSSIARGLADKVLRMFGHGTCEQCKEPTLNDADGQHVCPKAPSRRELPDPDMRDYPEE